MHKKYEQIFRMIKQAAILQRKLERTQCALLAIDLRLYILNFPQNEESKRLQLESERLTKEIDYLFEVLADAIEDDRYEGIVCSCCPIDPADRHTLVLAVICFMAEAEDSVLLLLS